MKKHIRILAGFMATALLISVHEFNSIKKISAEDKLSSLKSQQIELDKQQKDLNVHLENLKNDITKKREYRSNVLEQMNTLQNQINIESQKIEILDGEISERQIKIDGFQRNIDENIGILCGRLKAIYKAGDIPEVAILLGAKSFDDLLDTADMIQKLSQYDAGLIKNLKDSISEIQQEKNDIERSKNEVVQSKLLLDEKRQELDTLQQENERLIRDLMEEKSNIQSKINSNNLKRRSLENKIAGLTKRGNSSMQFSTTGYKKGRYIWPVPGYGRISSGWGDGRNHNGIDIPAPQGTKVVAMADGVVVKANSSSSWGSGWGYHVRINHGDGFETMSAHLSKVLVKPGQEVKAGQVIGLVGNTGYSFGNHLHCGTAKNGRWYNPRNEL